MAFQVPDALKRPAPRLGRPLTCRPCRPAPGGARASASTLDAKDDVDMTKSGLRFLSEEAKVRQPASCHHEAQVPPLIHLPARPPLPLAGASPGAQGQQSREDKGGEVRVHDVDRGGGDRGGDQGGQNELGGAGAGRHRDAAQVGWAVPSPQAHSGEVHDAPQGQHRAQRLKYWLPHSKLPAGSTASAR